MTELQFKVAPLPPFLCSASSMPLSRVALDILRPPTAPGEKRIPGREQSIGRECESTVSLSYLFLLNGSRMETAKLTSKGQIVIPKRIRDVVRAKPGTEFSVRLEVRGSSLTPHAGKTARFRTGRASIPAEPG